MIKNKNLTTSSQLLTTYRVEGMHCESCAKMIELDLEDEGIVASCDYASCELNIKDNPKGVEIDKIKKVVEKSGYKLASN
jgi:copper chaperone CopZ